MSKPYPKEFRDDVVRVARNRGPGVELSQIAKVSGIHVTTLYAWMKKADIEDGDDGCHVPRRQKGSRWRKVWARTTRISVPPQRATVR